jgi:hypothetical protein
MTTLTLHSVLVTDTGEPPIGAEHLLRYRGEFFIGMSRR